MHYILLNGRVVCTASEFVPDPPKIWQPGMDVQFTTEVFRAERPGLEIEIIDFTGQGWAAVVVEDRAFHQSSERVDIRVTAKVLKKISVLPEGKDEIAKYIHQTFRDLVHLSLENYTDSAGAAMIDLVLKEGRRPVIHKPGMPPTEARLNEAGGLDWLPFPGVEAG
jgi:hypothetical protein